MTPASRSPAIKILITVSLETLLFLIARKYTKGAVIKRSNNIPLDNNSLFTVNFDENVISKQIEKIKKGIPRAIVQFGLLVLDMVILIKFIIMAACVRPGYSAGNLYSSTLKESPNEKLLPKVPANAQ